ncbi:globin-coupled sensor protein [Paraburkholderia caballeronis]|uniref:Methyl-accepting chemotaxis protein n=1 Tax=Paraburkholderia caballeronis TaxID=416943 RepID=A0A1H7M3N7_9BURK|nr:globin-coupled sensor protein [Paraburkholderia caballeronis]PXW28710.1 methyl-accepting chemotaxis protein [Paraburkholderia caballeronis]PXX04076.1 methyl-accepting chemotaxis protein [Paraburkholderia caballeronis]RAK04820.1 methyl-accepting chemotaxis protein [Paraburkholderia caballeronis]TDV39137.1 methyl-accepting chemotaxis protein [Paraburkholderia caballeronis]SED63223.1 Methyl-accepting chemotaxis protein [Paraburkholderia caballeronis]
MKQENPFGRQFSVSATERDQRLHFIGFTELDARLLRELAPVIEPHADRIVDAFYHNVALHPELIDIIQRAGSTVDRLKAKQRGYLLDMFCGEYGEAYFGQRLAIGVVHNRIGLGPQWFLGSYALYARLIVPLIMRRYRWRPRRQEHAIQALYKIISLDSQLVIDTYVHGVTSELNDALCSYTAFVERVATGQLDSRVALPENAGLAQLGVRLNEMTANLGEMASRTDAASHGLTSMVNALQDAVTTQSSGANQQAAAINETTSTLEEIRAISRQTQEKAEMLGATADRTRTEGERGAEIVDKTIHGMEVVRAQVNDIAEKILALSEQTHQIGEITGTVNSLAQQLKMLSLNASIEAAKAGEAGKGFAVVAAEVKELAEQSQQATVQVNAILQEIQRATDKAVMATEEGSKGVDRGTQMVQQVGDAMQSLMSAIREAAMSSQHIVAAVRQEGIGIDQIATAMREINTATRQAVDSTQQTRQSAEQLSALAREMRDSVRLYRLEP